MKYSALAAVGLVALFSTAAHADRITTSECGHIENSLTQEHLEVIEKLYKPGSSMRAGTHSFEVWHRKDSNDKSIVISRYANGQVCYAPIPPELNPF